MKNSRNLNQNMAIRGTCREMCPLEETKFREKERMLHFLEMVPGTEALPKPIADKSRTVKMHTRSAAGSNISLPKNLRTVEALLKTVNYLLNDVITSKILPWHHIYDFIADRLLAVRQDMLIQRLSTSYYISLLEPIIRFYTYSAYRLCEHPIEQFDPVLNNNHLQESLKRLLKLYDESEYFSDSEVNVRVVDSSSRSFFEALYIIFNLGDTNAIIRGLSIKREWRTEIVRRSLDVSMAVLQGNWYRACIFMKKLPTLLAAIVSLHLPSIRREALKRMEVAYNSKNLTYPLDTLQEQLLYSNKTDLINDCIYYNIKLENDAIKFTKDAINQQDVAKPKQEEFVRKKLSRKSVSDLVLHGDIW